ncbi:hypothetical protein BZA05DRAFT_168064 [Tricharina praecox]|uniref:uncharacterized protein n=1 Tax=Tricharina praecox TaxID=43433 RepID=UPI00221E9242|nr:uncharacterized protein BZA05DRAFT_168064 [Tricharina praecox]KAI5857183.1 hypothetical protein BZA05DRAFT_168064 [Tricharina praecox]
MRTCLWTLDFGLCTLHSALWTLDHAPSVDGLPELHCQTPATTCRKWRAQGCGRFTLYMMDYGVRATLEDYRINYSRANGLLNITIAIAYRHLLLRFHLRLHLHRSSLP